MPTCKTLVALSLSWTYHLQNPTSCSLILPALLTQASARVQDFGSLNVTTPLNPDPDMQNPAERTPLDVHALLWTQGQTGIRLDLYYCCTNGIQNGPCHLPFRGCPYPMPHQPSVCKYTLRCWIPSSIFITWPQQQLSTSLDPSYAIR
jgi:hypothetical protein